MFCSLFFNFLLLAKPTTQKRPTILLKMMDPVSVLTLWFGEGGTCPKNDLTYVRSRTPLWFSRNEGFEKQQTEYKQTIDDVRNLETSNDANQDVAKLWNTPRGYLARVILFDQLPRSLYRGTPKAFEYDPLAVKYALKIVDENLWGQFAAAERLFIVVAIQHAENLLLQEKGVGLAPRIPEGENEDIHTHFAGLKSFHTDHHDAVARFGRFPGRNAVLVSFVTINTNFTMYLFSSIFQNREGNLLQRKQLGSNLLSVQLGARVNKKHKEKFVFVIVLHFLPIYLTLSALKHFLIT
jgi:uncharacterized protein (DUF924 family)